HHHNVEEWSNLDPFSGIREQKRVETDHWANNTRNSSHQYGKVVDSRARNLADGTREQMQQMKQLEVFQARVPGGGSVQVIRSHTSTTSSKISGHSWTNSSKMIDTSTPSFEPSSDFDNLKLSIMPLNLNTEKTKVNLGRSGSLTKRRPPTRPRSLLCSNDEPSEIISTTAIPLEEPKMKPKIPAQTAPVPKMRLAELATNADRIGTRYTTPTVKSIKSEISKSSKTSVEKPAASSTPYKSPTIVRNESLKSPKIFRSLITKRTVGGIDSSSDNEHRPLEAKKSVSSEDVSQDYGQDGIGSQGLDRSSSARRSLNLHKDYHWSSQHTNELENVFKKVLKNKTFYNRIDFDGDDNLEDERTQPLTASKKSFVSAETIKNIRNNLKPVEDVIPKVAEDDDRVPSQVVMKNGDTSRFNGEGVHVKNYNTGSLENKQSRNEEWYNRRKSYGFEQMKDLSESHHTSGNSLKNIESSTDSGIAKSNEHIDSLVKKGIANPANDLFEVRRNSLSKNSKIYSTLMSLRDSNKKSDFENSAIFSNNAITVEQFGTNGVHAGREPMNNTMEHNGVSKIVTEAQNEPVCITIKPKEEHTSVINIPNKNEMKVESTMDDNGEYFRKVKEIYDKGAWENGDSKKPKKVEFSKTEVHFEPGKVNIIETNEKPPPTNYRRRRKERLAERQAERAERSQAERPSDKFPETKFGDEIEKPIIALPYEPKVQEPIPHEGPIETNIEIVVDESEDDSKKPKSILKSAMKFEETTNENIDQTKTDFKKILNSFKTSERQNSTGSPPVIDNGLKVRITSGNNQFDQRRASWCVPENGNKYSTKINFGADNITILPQKTRYSYCEPSTRTIQSICSQPTNGQDSSHNTANKNPIVGHAVPIVPINNLTSCDEYSRFRTKSPLSKISKTTISNTNPLGSTSFFVHKQEVVTSSDNRPSENVSKHLESVPRRHPEKSNEMSAILNRYSYTETSKSPIMSEQPTRFSYCEPASSTSEPIWYQHERQAKNQFSSTPITASKPTIKKESMNDPPQVTSISLHYEPKPAKPKTFQPVCLIYKPESPTNKRIQDYEKNKTESANSNEEVKTYHKEKTEVIAAHIREEKRSNRESTDNGQRTQSNKITNDLKKINDSIKLTSTKHVHTRKTEKIF
ncbi:hypothetical protein WDU94_006187, partial [Cyamophila willieti]